MGDALPTNLAERLAAFKAAPETPEQRERRLAALGAERDAEQFRRVGRLIEQAGIPARYRDAHFDGAELLPADAREGYEFARQELWTLLNSPGMVALVGKRGAGKTYLACALVRFFCLKGRAAVYAEAMDYFLSLQATFDAAAKTSADSVERRYLSPELLVLDAMEERADTPWNDRMLVRLVNKRYAAGLSTVMVSNQTPAEFYARVGESITDRLKDGGCTVECKWPSLRGRLGFSA